MKLYLICIYKYTYWTWFIYFKPITIYNDNSVSISVYE